MSRNTRTLTFIYGNLCGNPKMPMELAESDLITVKAEDPDFVLLNEIWVPYYKKAVRNVFRHDRGWELDHLQDSANPIITRSAVGTVTNAYKLTAHRGYRLVTPERTVTGIRVNINGLNRTIVVTNRHYVSGAWNKKYKFRKRLRKRLWCKMYDEDRHFVETMTSQGHIVISFGDINKIDPEPFNSRSYWLDDNGIVKAQVSYPRNPDVNVEVVKQKSIRDVHTDKPYNLLKLRFSAVGNA